MICMFCGVKMDLYVFKKNTFSAKDWHLAISTASADQAGKVHWLPNWEIGPEKKKSLQKSKLKKILLQIFPQILRYEIKVELWPTDIPTLDIWALDLFFLFILFQ